MLEKEEIPFHKLPLRIFCMEAPTFVCLSCSQALQGQRTCWMVWSPLSASHGFAEHEVRSEAVWLCRDYQAPRQLRELEPATVLDFLLKGIVRISKVPMNPDLFVCVFSNRAEIMTHFSWSCICSPKPQQPPAEVVVFAWFQPDHRAAVSACWGMALQLGCCSAAPRVPLALVASGQAGSTAK